MVLLHISHSTMGLCVIIFTRLCVHNTNASHKHAIFTRDKEVSHQIYIPYNVLCLCLSCRLYRLNTAGSLLLSHIYLSTKFAQNCVECQNLIFIVAIKVNEHVNFLRSHKYPTSVWYELNDIKNHLHRLICLNIFIFNITVSYSL